MKMRRARSGAECEPEAVKRTICVDVMSLRRESPSADILARTRSGWLKFVALYLELGIKLCRFNPAGDFHEAPKPASRRRNQWPVWSRLVQIFYFYFTLKLLASLILQHQYNELTWDLVARDGGSNSSSSSSSSSGSGPESQKRAQEEEANRTANESHHHWRQEQKRAQLELTISRLQLIGNAYYEIGAPIEPLYLAIGYISCLAYLQPLLYVAARGPVLVDVVRIFLNPQRYQRLVLAHEIEHQASRYMGSSVNYIVARLVCAPSVGRDKAKQRQPGSLLSGQQLASSEQPGVWREASLRELALSHERDARQVAELVASGALVPPNRRASWIVQMARIHVSLVVLTNLLCSSFSVALLIVLPRLCLDTLEQHNRPRDLLFQAELLCFCALVNQCFIFYMVTFIVTALDQIVFVEALRRMIASLTGELPALEPRANETTPGRARGLIRLLIHYELLKKQLKCTQTAISFVTANILILMLIMPVLARLYVAQMAPGHRHIFLACSLLIITCCDMVLLPYCWLHARCLELLRARSRLLANIDARLFALRRRHPAAGAAGAAAAWPAASSSLSQWRTSHDEHTVCLLRREQQAPELAMRVFAVDAYFMRLTYASLLGVHFWCALLLAPLCMRDPARPHGAGDNLLALIFR